MRIFEIPGHNMRTVQPLHMLKGQNLTFNLNKLFFFENHNENFAKCLFIVSELLTAPTLLEEETGGSLCSGVFYFSTSL